MSGITEKEICSEISGHLNNYLNQIGNPFEKTTVEHSVTVGYPDITIWINYERQEPFSFWEIKRPGFKEDMVKVLEKATVLNIKFVVVWDFQNGTLYEIENNKFLIRKSYPLPLLNNLTEWKIIPKQNQVIGIAKQILDDLIRLHKGDNLLPFAPDKFYFINILQKSIFNLKPILEKKIIDSKKDKEKKQALNRWTVAQGYPLSLPNLDELLARQWAYSLTVRILFYFTIRRYYPALPELTYKRDTSVSINNLLKEAFLKAQSVDWQAVFELSPLDSLEVPNEAEPIIGELLNDMHRFDFGQLKEDVIGQIMEGLIPQEERHALGQYFTREDLVDMIIGFVALKEDAYYLDPTCGSGTFLNRLYSRLKWLSGYKSCHSKLLNYLWGVDIANFPAELATINLFRQDIKDTTNFPRIIVSDFFKLSPGDPYFFPPLRPSDDPSKKIRVKLPLFDGIVGNFPYIRQELIERQYKGYKNFILQRIASYWFWKSPGLFNIKGIRESELQKVWNEGPEKHSEWLKEQINKGRIDLGLSGQADIYSFLFFHAATFLKPGGRMGIVTSNAWLDVDYGIELKRFFLKHFKIIAIVASWEESWFEDAGINTAFIILERCENKEQRDNNIVRFVKLKKPLSYLLPQDLIFEDSKRWQTIDSLVNEIEVSDSYKIEIDPVTGSITILEGIKTYEDEKMRICLLTQKELEDEINNYDSVPNWGKYLRAPNIYFEILEKAKDNLVALKSKAQVRYGIKPGISDFFYLEITEDQDNAGLVKVKNARGWEGYIEKDFLVPFFISLKQINTYHLKKDKLKTMLFMCPFSYNELKKRGYSNTLRYIDWGKTQKTSGKGRVGTKGVPFPQVKSVRSHRPDWFNISQREPAKIISNNFIGKRFVFPINDDIFVSNTFFEIIPNKEDELHASLINSSLIYLFLEVTGRQTWSQGVLYIYGPELKNLLIVDPDKINKDLKKEIIGAFNKLSSRAAYPINDEINKKDRIRLDNLILKAIGLDPDIYRPQIYSGLKQLVEERHRLQVFKKAKQKMEKVTNIEKIREHIQEEIFPNGSKPIESFLPSGRIDYISISLTGRPVLFRQTVGLFTFLDHDNNEIGELSGNEDQALYVIYAAKPNVFIINIPKDMNILRNTKEKYENYLREEVGKKLINRAFEATKDINLAERITRDILEKLGLPRLAIEKALE